MSSNNTAAAVASLTDEGRFELLAMAILMEADTSYRSLAHTGVNAEGKTVRCPVDAIGFVRGADPLHLVIAHHTTTRAKDLEGKWLHDPSTVTPRTAAGPTEPPGDLLKAAQIATLARSEIPGLKVTLVLTTNQEPDPGLITKVTQLGKSRGMDVEIWSRSRLVHELDFRPSGQWIRAQMLGIEQDLLSSELLQDLSKKSLEVNCPLDEPGAWIARPLEETLSTGPHPNATFLLGRSGLGKSVICWRLLQSHLSRGMPGLVISDDSVAAASTLEHAIQLSLQQLHPALSLRSPSALAFASPDRPLLLIVEDINRAGRTVLLAEKLARWSKPQASNGVSSRAPWRLVCALWPEALASAGEQLRRQVEPLCIPCGSLSEEEGKEAVHRRAGLTGRTLSDLKAREISAALGNDPLLIALYDFAASPDPQGVVGGYVLRSLERVVPAGGYTATDYHVALRALGLEMLSRRALDPAWQEIRSWTGLSVEALQRLVSIVSSGEIAQLSGPSPDQRLAFRHDRVRDWILSDALAEALRVGGLPDDVLRDPFFAEVIAGAFLRNQSLPGFVDRVARENPLVLFFALKFLGPAMNPTAESVLTAIDQWLGKPETHEVRNARLRWYAVAALAETDRPEIPKMALKFRENLTAGWLARLRNGDLMGGLALCVDLEPGVTAPWRDVQIDHASMRYGRNLASALSDFLKRTDIDDPLRVGGLRLAGHIHDPQLAEAIEASWSTDVGRVEHLGDYLWAAAECCGSDPKRYLDPICAAWAALSDEPEKANHPSARESVATPEVRWAFHRWPPINAVDYFCARAMQPDLSWPIEYMLHGLDHPRAVSFVVNRMAERQRELEGTDHFSPYLVSAADDWRRAQERNHPMSPASRKVLLELWQNNGNDKCLRERAFVLWSATELPDDLPVLRAVSASDLLADRVLAERLRRSDEGAIPQWLPKLRGDGHLEYWWHFGRHVWSPELTAALDRLLATRRPDCQQWFQDARTDWIASELTMRLTQEEAEALLSRHWDSLHFSPRFVQAAVYVATERTRALARAAVSQCPTPGRLFEHVCTHMGVQISGRAGITTEAQVRALAEYFDLLSPLDFRRLWDECNRQRLYRVRRELLDVHPQAKNLGGLWNSARVKEYLDTIVGTSRVHWIDHWIDDVTKTGVTWREIRDTLFAWLDERRSLAALLLILAAIERRGARSDLEALTVPPEIQQSAEEVLLDARFVVWRTRLH